MVRAILSLVLAVVPAFNDLALSIVWGYVTRARIVGWGTKRRTWILLPINQTLSDLGNAQIHVPKSWIGTNSSLRRIETPQKIKTHGN